MPGDPYAEVRRICAGLPEVVETPLESGVRFKIRARDFANVFEVDRATLLTFFADTDEREYLLARGHPFFAPNSYAKRVGMVIDDATDWTEVAELVTESYRFAAPKKLVRLLDET